MQPLNIEPTSDSPKIILDGEQQIFLIEGESRPESSSKLFRPVIAWIEEYKNILYWQKKHFGKNRRMTLQIKLIYFNSTSAKFLSDIFSLLDSICKEGYEVRVKWFYQKEDTDMKEAGEEYMKMMKNLSFKLVLLVMGNQNRDEHT